MEGFHRYHLIKGSCFICNGKLAVFLIFFKLRNFKNVKFLNFKRQNLRNAVMDLM